MIWQVDCFMLINVDPQAGTHLLFILALVWNMAGGLLLIVYVV